MRNVLKPVRRINRKPLKHARRKDIAADKFEGIDGPINTQHLLISTLIAPAVKQFLAQLESEVATLCGARYEHGGGNQRWGSQNGSIILGNQHVAIERPRVRGKDGEVNLETYEQFQDPKLFNQAVFTEGLKKVSQRDYASGVQKIANSFGLEKSSISRRWINATAKKLEQLQKRSLKDLDGGAALKQGHFCRSAAGMPATPAGLKTGHLQFGRAAPSRGSARLAIWNFFRPTSIEPRS
jgi:hypothetical protein